MLSNTARYEVYPGQLTNAKCKVRQGATAEGNAGASVLLEYRDADGVVVSAQEGNRVMSATKGAVYDSKVLGTAPAGAATVNIASNGIRFRENKPLFVDDFEWDHTVAAVGLDHQAEFRLTLQVTDSAGRSAIWRGFIGDHPVYFTSKPFALEVVESVAPWFDIDLGAIRTPPQVNYAEGMDASAVFLGGEIRTPLQAYSIPPEGVDPTIALLSGELRVVQITYSMQAEGVDQGIELLAGSLNAILITTAMAPEGVDPTLSILSGTLA